jgi:hypothetical protein
MRTIAFVCVLALAAGCAASPPAEPPPARVAVQGGTTRVYLNGDAVRSAVAPGSDANKELAKFARMQGFKPNRVGDRVLWCKSEAEIGSHIARNNCVSDDTLVEMRRVYDANKQDMLNATQGCQSSAACSGR